MVVEGGGKRLAVECDGDRYHPLEKLGEDMERQAILERLGWQFVRIRGSAFYRDPDRAMKPVFARLAELNLPPEEAAEDESATDMTLVHELKELMLLSPSMDGLASEESELEALGDMELDDLLAESLQQQATVDKTLVQRVLKGMGGRGPLDEFLRRYAKTKGFRRLGKNIRQSLENELAVLAKSGEIQLSHGWIMFPMNTPA